MLDGVNEEWHGYAWIQNVQLLRKNEEYPKPWNCQYVLQTTRAGTHCGPLQQELYKVSLSGQHVLHKPP